GSGAADQREVEELDGHLSLEAPVAPPRQPHAAHAALAERSFERVRADDRALQRRLRRTREPRQRAQESSTVALGLTYEQAPSLRHDGTGRSGTKCGQADVPLVRIEIEQLVEQLAECRPRLLVEGHRQAPRRPARKPDSGHTVAAPDAPAQGVIPGPGGAPEVRADPGGDSRRP